MLNRRMGYRLLSEPGLSVLRGCMVGLRVSTPCGAVVPHPTCSCRSPAASV